MNNLKDDVRRSVVCTAVFAAVFGLIVACSKSSNPTTITGNIGGLIRLVSHTTPNMIGLPNNLNSNQPFMATFFQAASQQASQIQQSFQGESCGGDIKGLSSIPAGPRPVLSQFRFQLNLTSKSLKVRPDWHVAASSPKLVAGLIL
jgi:hypothetical protein